MLPRRLETLELRCNNAAHRPVMDALNLLCRDARRPGTTRCYDAVEEVVPIEGVVPPEWHEAVVDDAGRIERVPYELCVLPSLREVLRRREVWVVGAGRWRDPEADLPQDFEANRVHHYAALRQPLDSSTFVTELRQRMTAELDDFDGATSTLAASASTSARGRKIAWCRSRPLSERPWRCTWTRCPATTRRSNASPSDDRVSLASILGTLEHSVRRGR